jgi:phage terminase small subunit
MLTPKQLRFVDEYLVDLNASAAARRAGYSPTRADAMGHENLRKPEIAAAIAAAQAKRAERTRIDADWVLQRLAQIADADMADLFGPDGCLLPVASWPGVWRRGLVVGLDVVEEPRGPDAPPAMVRKVKQADRLKVLELIGRHVLVGAWRDKLELSGADGGPVQVERVERVIVDPKPEHGA